MEIYIVINVLALLMWSAALILGRAPQSPSFFAMALHISMIAALIWWGGRNG